MRTKTAIMAMNPNSLLLSINSLQKRFDGVLVLDKFSCNIERGRIVGLIGPNGAGKTTLFNVLTGFVSPDAGSARFDGIELIGQSPHRIASLGIVRSFQTLRLAHTMSVLDNALLSFRFQPGERLTNLVFRRRLCLTQERTNFEKAKEILDNFGLAQKIHVSAESLSYGQKKLLNLICCIIADPSLVLLDEPLAGIAPHIVEKVLSLIRIFPDQGRSALIIEHDIDAISRICHKLIVMDAGTCVSEGSPQAVRSDPKVIATYLK